MHVVLTDVDDHLYVKIRFDVDEPFLAIPDGCSRLQRTLQLATVSKPLPIAEGGGRMGTVALTDRAYGLGTVSSYSQTHTGWPW